jgi:hypothetical protein
MSYAEPGRCARPECPRTYQGHKWGRIKAGEEGWFFPRDSGEAYCPDHLPPWVQEWRARKAELSEGDATVVHVSDHDKGSGQSG